MYRPTIHDARVAYHRRSTVAIERDGRAGPSHSLLPGDNSEQIVVILCRSFAFAFDGGSDGSVLFEQIERQVSDHRRILRDIAISDTTVVLPKRYVQRQCSEFSMLQCRRVEVSSRSASHGRLEMSSSPQDASGKALSGRVERWLGKARAEDVRRESAGVVDAGAVGESPYAPLSSQGATIVPRRLFFVEETENTAIVRAAPTVAVGCCGSATERCEASGLELCGGQDDRGSGQCRTRSGGYTSFARTERASQGHQSYDRHSLQWIPRSTTSLDGRTRIGFPGQWARVHGQRRSGGIRRLQCHCALGRPPERRRGRRDGQPPSVPLMGMRLLVRHNLNIDIEGGGRVVIKANN